MLLLIRKKKDVEAIYASGETGVLKKYKENSIITGRSPFSSICLTIKPVKHKKIFIKTEDLDSATLSDLVDINWLKQSGKDKESYEVLVKWSDINSSLKLQEDLFYDERKEKMIKERFFEALKLFDYESESDTIEFVGYGTYIDVDKWNDLRISILPGYKNSFF